MDITDIQTLDEVIGELRKRGMRVLLSEANSRVLGKLRKAGVVDMLHAGGYGASFQAALKQAQAAGQPADGGRTLP